MTDDRIDSLIRDFQGIAPTEEQILKWTLATTQRSQRRRATLQISMSLAAGILIGIVGASLFYKAMNRTERSEEFSATFAMVSVKNLSEN